MFFVGVVPWYLLVSGVLGWSGIWWVWFSDGVVTSGCGSFGRGTCGVFLGWNGNWWLRSCWAWYLVFVVPKNMYLGVPSWVWYLGLYLYPELFLTLEAPPSGQVELRN
jgi:hypothetical protein